MIDTNTKPVAKISNLSFTYRDAPAPALRNVSATIAPGEFVVVMGASGSGKSTLLYALNGSVPGIFRGDYSGSVELDGRVVAGQPVAETAATAGLLLQDFESQTFSATVEEDFAFGLENLAVERGEMVRRVDRYLALAGVESLRSRHAGTLSGGQQQRATLGAVMAMEPRLIVLDEPTTDLDPLARDEVLRFLLTARDRGAAIVVSDHRTETALLADTVWLMHDARLVASGPPRVALADHERLRSLAIQPDDLSVVEKALGSSLQNHEAAAAIRAHPGYRVPSAPPEEAREPRPVAVELRSVQFAYAPTARAAFSSPSLEVSRGDVVAVVGPNGAGKSTLLKLLSRVLKPTQGEILIDGRPIRDLPRRVLATHVQHVFQNPDHQIFSATVFEEVAFALRRLGHPPDEIRPRVEEALDAMGLAALALEDPVHLSKGQRHRVAIASALALRPGVLLLDEPTKGLDEAGREGLAAQIGDLNARGHTVVFSSHNLDFVANVAHSVLVVDEGRIVLQGTPREVFGSGAVLPDPLPLPFALSLRNELGAHAMTIESILREVLP